MADTTPRLGLPLLAAAQAQKHVTHNEALAALDALVQLACLDKDRAAPPDDASEGDRYLVAAANPAGAWAGLSGRIVRYEDGVWVGVAPRPGWLAYVIDEADFYVFSGSAWTSFRAGLTALQNLTGLGIGTAADAVNRFALKADAALLSWDDVTPGSGGLRVILNKQAAGKDAVLAIQTGFSTRALFGTLGSDDVSLTVSPDGTAFSTVLTASATTGRLGLGRIDGPLEVSAHSGALPAPPDRTVLRVSGGDGQSSRLVFDGFGGAAPGEFVFRAAAGTAANPTTLPAGETIGRVSAFGYGATGYGGAARAQIGFLAAEPWSDTAQGARIVLRTTPAGTSQIAEVFCAEANGAIRLMPLAAAPSTGPALGQIYADSTATALKWHTGTAWARISNFAKFAATTNFDNYVPAGAWTKLQFNSADSNDQGAFSPAANRFVAPEAGLYGFEVALAFKANGTNAPSAFEARLHRNGAPANRGRASATGTLVDGITSLGLCSSLTLAAGDTVEVFVRFTGADGYVAASESLFAGRQTA